MLVLCILLFKLAFRFGKQFELNTIGEFANKASEDNYFLSRRNPNSFNKIEIVQKIRNLFAEGLDLDKSILIPEATFKQP